MKILMVSMFSSHFFNWTQQLEEAGHEIYWIDVYDSNTYVKKIDFVCQIIGWRNKIKYPGRYILKRKFPKIYNFTNKFNQQNLAELFEEKLKEIQPDVVHSFEMFSSCVPILEVIKKYPEIKWIYSVWGNDLFYFKNHSKALKNIKEVFFHLDYMFTDCLRDFKIANQLGFKGEFLGVYPTGGGYDFEKYDPFIKVFAPRKIILIKGYQHQFGRCNKILEAISGLKELLADYNIIVFSANSAVIEYSKELQLNTWENIMIYEQLSHDKVLKLMGESKIYIGNSISDGMPNTLLEAIIMGAFPIQSNPGGATEEIIIHGLNGLLIKNPKDAVEIGDLIKKAVSDKTFLVNGVEYNNKNIKPKLQREIVENLVLEKYRLIENKINSQLRYNWDFPKINQ